MGSERDQEFVSIQEFLISMMISFLKYVLENYTQLKPGEDTEILSSFNLLYLNMPRHTTLVVDVPTIVNADVAEPNLAGVAKYKAGPHMFMVSGSFNVHCVTKNEVSAHRLATLLYVVTLAKEVEFAKYGFSELKATGIGSTIVLNADNVEDTWFDVPVNFRFTANLGVTLEKQLKALEQIRVDIDHPTLSFEIRVKT